MNSVKFKMVFYENEAPNIYRQCKLLKLSRSTFYRLQCAFPKEDPDLIKKAKEKMLKLHEEEPCSGARTHQYFLSLEEVFLSRYKIGKLMKELRIRSLAPGPNTSKSCPEHKKYAYLLRDVAISKPNQVWCTDITYIKTPSGFAYLVAVLDWHSRRVISWSLSNSMDKSFCIEALKDALEYGTPEVFNTDQGSQFTSNEFTEILINKGIKISMDGKGRALDNVIVERFWRSIKYERLLLNEYKNLQILRDAIESYIYRYNHIRPHQSLDNAVPDDVWRSVA
jgi:putative transposase